MSPLLRSFLAAAVAVVLAAPGLALAQVEVRVGLPGVRFEVAPALVVVSPGVQVVPDYDEEVFVVQRHYWVRHEGHWYRSPDYSGRWTVVEHRHVPGHLRGLTPGRYRRYKHVVHHTHGHEHGEVRHTKHHRKHHDKHEKHHRKHHKHHD